ncbi:holo-ACP synthase [Idiomarina seosinensis]|uniref:Holo-[acyl-carrier-protein] synthase n=1 Tax=Idiomarina seosinensis TaxID=281739 RepID=A0A432ZHS7_9GAMM|nr:holo-ACP synthase [Idiomarina seosinensis]RUO77370.1 holo-ACP synthase [Idiomarina seosinensis]
MAIYGIGTDIVEVARIQASLGRGQGLAKRILTEQEFEQMQGDPSPDHYLAKRFAAKEACAKAFGLGIAEGLSFQNMEVTHDQWGKPSWQFTGTAAKLLEERAITASHLSISDEKNYAVATVILETDGS